MISIEGTIQTEHKRPECVAASLSVDNLSMMTTSASGTRVKTTVRGRNLRSVIASVDDYLMNLAAAEEICSYVSH